MLSKPDVYGRLADQFIGVRFDWEQGNHYKNKIGFILGTGDQMLLTPGGEPIPHDRPAKGAVAKSAKFIYGRHGCDTTAAVLNEITTKYPPKAGAPELKIEWFFWPRMQSATRKGGFYPVAYTSAAQYARLPLAIVDGPLPDALRDPAFLRWHVRQFIWARGKTDGPARIVIRRVKDGLVEGAATELADLDATRLSSRELGKALDAAWIAYMKDRPFTARGYLENEHGGWMRSVKDQMLGEELDIRKKARDGTLLAPGRKPGEAQPY